MVADRAPAVALGQRIHFQEQTWTVVAVSGTTVTLQGSAGQLSAVLVMHLVAATDFQVLDQPRVTPVPPDSLVEGLDSAQRSRVRRLERHILQVDTGVLPDDEGSVGDARYDLGATTVNERVRAKIAELAGTDLAVSVRQFHRLRVAYRADGAVGLVERRVRDRLAGRDPLAGADERVLTALRDAMSGQASGSTITRKTMFVRVRSALSAAHGDALQVPSDRELYRLAAMLDRGRHTFGAATTRRTNDNRPGRPFTSPVLLRPGEQVQIDTNTIDILCRYADGVTRRAELTIAVDVATRSILAPPLVVAHYLTEAAALQTSVGKWRYTPATLSRWVSSINQFHTAAGLPPPGASEVVRRALSGVRRIRAIPPVRRSPLLLDDLRTLLLHLSTRVTEWPAGVAARRDAALLLMGFAGAHRRSELVGLTLADVTLHSADGLHVRLRSSKTDQEARGAVKALPYGRDPVTCPPCAFARWREVLHAFDIAPDGRARRAVMRVLRRQASFEPVGGGGEQQPDEEQGLLHVCRTIRIPEPQHAERAVFPTVHKTGAIGSAAMSGDAVNEMIRRRAEQAGFSPAHIALLGGHSLRAGFVTEAFRQGADAHSIMRQTGHRSPVMLEVYAREHAPLTGNAVTRLGL